MNENSYSNVQVNINESILSSNNEVEELENRKEEPLEENDPLSGSYTRIKQLTEAELRNIIIDKNKLLEYLTNVTI